MARSTDAILDEWLVLSAQGGEAEAFEALARRWHRRLIAHAFRRTGQAEGAAEAVQDAWLAIVRGLPTLDDPARFPGWAYRIVDHKAVDWVRRRGRRRSVERRIDTEDEAEALAPASSDSSPTEDERRDAVDRLRRLLLTLPGDQRAILSLFYTDGRSVREIAEVLGIPEGTVKSRLFHARKHLKLRMETFP